MKKKGFLFSIFVAICLFVLPSMVHAENIGLIFGSLDTDMKTTMMDDNETKISKSITVENNGANSVVYLGIKALENIPTNTSFTAKISLKNSKWKYVDCDSTTYSSSGWSVTCSKVSDAEVNVTAKRTNNAAMVKGTKAIVASLKLDGTAAQSDNTKTCSISLSIPEPENNPTCRKDGDTYYCANGASCTEAEYKKQCPTTENPQTGSFLPYAVIVGGVAVAVGLFMLTKKNKIYHI